MTPDPLPADLADLLDATLGPDGTPGVLADWLDERSEFWRPLARLLRQSEPLPPTAGHPGFQIGFRFRPAADGVLFWVVSVGHNMKWFQAPADGNVLLGVSRTTPGREAHWRRVVDRDAVPDDLRAAVWGLFPAPGG